MHWPGPSGTYFFDPEAGFAVTKPFVEGAAAFVFTFVALGFFASRFPRLLSVAMALSPPGLGARMARIG